jgi:hypothetical protein
MRRSAFILVALLVAGGAGAQQSDPPGIANPAVQMISGYARTMPRRIETTDMCSSAVGRFQYGIGGQGTGSVVVNSRLVLTNAHVVALDGKVKPRVVFELPDGGVDYTAHWGTVAAQGTRFPDINTNWQNDWAIVVLDASSGVRPLPIIVETPTAVMAEGRSLFTIGYSRFSRALPGSGDFFAVVSEQCAVLGSRANMLLHDCSTMAGGSGSPILARRGNYCSLVALHRGTMAQTPIEQTNAAAGDLNYAVMPAAFAPAVSEVLKQIKAGLWNAD